MTFDNDLLRSLLRETRTIAVVGASPRSERPSNYVMKYLQTKGYRIIPINPGVAGREILGERTYARLADVPAPVEMVNVFRASHAAVAVADDAVAVKDRLGLKCIWMQLGVRSDNARHRGEAAGLAVIMDRCIKIDHARLLGG